MSGIVQEYLLEEASTLIADKMGLHFPSHRLKDLERTFRHAAKELGFGSAEDCIAWFLKEPLTREKTDALASFITVGETYFFRENRCFEVLEQNILPDMIRDGRHGSKRLRIWSAGCATGEEPYSIAIMLHRMRHVFKDWEISILATDINMHALQRAMTGIYSAWSFRNTPDWLQKNYFYQLDDGRYELIPEIRRMVNFTYLNLAEDLYPSLLNETNALDIIFCRNVLMYFTPDRIRETLGRFSHCLVDEGWMVVSSCETSNLMFSSFSAAYYPDVILYRKTELRARETRFGAVPVKHPASLPFQTVRPQQAVIPYELKPVQKHAEAPVVKTERTLLQKAQALYDNGEYRAAEAAAQELLAKDGHSSEATVLLCRIYANEGRLEESLRLSEQAVAKDKLNAGNHYMHAMILLEQDKKGEAADALRRALYLDNDRPAAYFMLGNIARQSGQKKEARKHLRNALAVLERCNPEAEVADTEGLLAGKFAEMIRITLNTL